MVLKAVAAAREENAWNSRTMGWGVTAVVLMVAIGMVTYYYQVYEPTEEQERSVMQQTRLI